MRERFRKPGPTCFRPRLKLRRMKGDGTDDVLLWGAWGLGFGIVEGEEDS